MGVIYISTSFEEKDIMNIFSDTGKIHYAANKYNHLLCSGIAENQVNVTLLSILPVTRVNCNKLFVKSKRIKVGFLCKKYLSVINIPIVKNIFRAMQVFFCILFAKKDTAVVYDLFAKSANLGMIPAAKLRGFQRVCIVTDLPEDLSSRGERDKGFSYLIDNATGYVILTKYMSEKVNPTNKKEIIIEGVAQKNICADTVTRDKTKRIMYAGALEKKYGVDNLVNSFLSCRREGEELHLFGSGGYVDEIKELARDNSCIVYHGSRPNSEVMNWEFRVTLLVNPRTSEGTFTRYSFPSKVMEYFSTGTPVLMARLPGIPDEYYKYCYTFDDKSEDGLKIKLREVLDTSEEELLSLGESARHFVTEEKNSRSQAKKLIGLFDISEK